MFARRNSPAESKKPSWRFFFSSPAPSTPPIPSLRTTQSASSIPTLAKGHYRTHSSLLALHPDDPTAIPTPLGSGAQVVRTPSEARRGCMKARPARAPGLAAIIQTADLPMMEECDRRVSFTPAPSHPSESLEPVRMVHKSSSLATLGSSTRDKERSRRSQSITAVPVLIRELDKSHRTTFIPPSARPALAASQPPPLPFSATLLDISQRPAPSATDQIFLKVDFGFSLDERSNSTSGITIPLDILKRCGGALERFVQGHLEDMKDRADKAAEDDWGLRIVSHVPSSGSRPGMTDGESGTDSDLESEEYGSSALLRDEYLKSVWDSSPTSGSFGDIPPATISAKTPSVSRTSQYYTPPKKRAYVRNQYTQHCPFPTPSSPHLPSTAPLTIRRRATYLVLPSTEPRGHIIEIKVLLMRDAACWHHIAARLVQGSWARMDERRARGVMDELKWAGMEGLLDELKPVTVPELPPVPSVQSLECMEKRHKRMSSKSLKGDLSGVRVGGTGYL